MDKYSWRELIVSERICTVDGKELVTLVHKFLSECKYNLRMIAMLEKGAKNKLWHTHIAIEFVDEVKLTTLRSYIQKTFGKSNDKYDWKLKVIRKDLPQFFGYIFKDNVLLCAKDFDMSIYEKYKDTYTPKEEWVNKKKKDALQDIQKCVSRCNQCKEWNHKFCKEDVVKAVIKYYDDNHKVYDEYRMKNLCQTIYYREYKREYIDRLMDKI